MAPGRGCGGRCRQLRRNRKADRAPPRRDARGRVDVESGGTGAGTAFTVRLPLAAPSGSEREVLPESGRASPVQSLRLLVVDDNVDAAQALSSLLRLGGHSVRVAADGSEALRSVVEFDPQVIFLDIGMPGMSGDEVAQALRRMPIGERLVIAAVTGWGSSEDKARARDAGFDYHLTKPVDLDAIERILEPVSTEYSPSAVRHV